MGTLVEHHCPSCGAPMPPPSAVRAQRCPYCAALLAPGPGGWRPAAPAAREEPLVDPWRTRLWVGGLRYAILGRLARGASCDAFLARRDARITELVVIKVLRSPADHDRVERGERTLEALEKSQAQGAAHLVRWLPQRVARGLARLGLHGRDGERRMVVHRWRSGFVHTGLDVIDAHRSGIDAAHAVWMWKRLLEQLGWIHRSGVVHGAIAPEHALVHARDHGVVLVGWSRAARIGEDGAAPATDLAASAQLVLRLLGARTGGAAPEAVPRPLAELLAQEATRAAGAHDDAWALRDRLDAVARDVFGPPRFVPFAMPGW